MISLKKFLDSPDVALVADRDESEILTAALTAYGSALQAIGACSVEACPALGDSLKLQLSDLQAGIHSTTTPSAMDDIGTGVKKQLVDWGRRTARHYREKATEVKELLLVMARTAESVGARDQRCAKQMDEVTSRLNAIACLEDLSEIRASVKKSAAELKISIDRMTSEGKAVLDDLRQQVSTYQTKLEEAEEVASRDLLTGLRSRLCLESLIESRMAAGGPFCLAMIDIDGFKKVNDVHGHLAGDELLKQFASELKSACRSTDAIGRWGGDEFLILIDCSGSEAGERIDRLRRWACGDYTVSGTTGTVKLRLEASIGLAEYAAGEQMNDLMARADAAMYEDKSSTHQRT